MSRPPRITRNRSLFEVNLYVGSKISGIMRLASSFAETEATVCRNTSSVNRGLLATRPTILALLESACLKSAKNASFLVLSIRTLTPPAKKTSVEASK